MEAVSVGLNYHRHLDAEILLHRREIQHVEIMVDHFMFQKPEAWAILTRLKKFTPVVAHGVGLSLGSADGLDPRYTSKLIHFLDFLRPEWFSEHLAFTRFGGRDLGHFAPLPRNPDAVSVLQRNLSTLRSELRCPVLLENIAAPFTMPVGVWDEAEFLQRVLEATGCELLLDLHNLHANAVNQGFDSLECLENLPLERVREVHMAGGFRDRRWLVDSHTRPVPPEVYILLGRLRALGFQPVVTLEWDDDFPPFQVLLDQVERARIIMLNSPTVSHRPKAPSPVSQPPAVGVGLAELQESFIRSILEGDQIPREEAGIAAEDLRHFARSLSRKRERKERSGRNRFAAESQRLV